jgi:hypothetical protein
MPKTLIQHIASTVRALANCERMGDRADAIAKHKKTLINLAKLLPSGSGINSGTKIDADRSSGEKVVLTAGFHHMNDSGFYDGWTEHTITIRPAFDGLNVTISGRDRNQIKEYLCELYDYALTRRYSWTYDQAVEQNTFTKEEE